MNLKDQVVVVTGAGGGGSGQAVARRFAQLGAAVVVSDIDESASRQAVRSIAAGGGRAEFCRADVAKEADLRSLFEFVENRLGGLDILVNNAGPYYHASPLEHWSDTIQANLWGTMYSTLLAIEALRRRGGGAIVNIGSTSAVGHGRKHSLSPAYDVAKSGVMRLTTTLGWLRERDGIRVNCLVPDWVASQEVREYVEGLNGAQRKERGVPEMLLPLDEIADLVVQIATDDSLAGRVIVWWCGHAPRLIADDDPGYSKLEPA